MICAHVEVMFMEGWVFGDVESVELISLSDLMIFCLKCVVNLAPYCIIVIN